MKSYLLYRVNLNLTVIAGKVAQKVGIRQDTVSNFELNPNSTKLETFFKLLSALNLEMEIHPKDAKNNLAHKSEWKEEW
ncbi:helix-turn-helix domain-containing protein [Proteus terrae]|uniref:helix-turn-helix domain-containing protein n=1 Tax=Proteus terrae TaxID=1574161 RepID=UPI001EEBF6A6|nr:helix-turn-helix domain-containing protein [Proteus terrae]